MQPILTNAQMREADEYTIQTLGVPAQMLMERAGRALAAQAQTMASGGRVLCMCGSGNNGGDGYVCARILRENGREVDCFSVEQPRSDACKNSREQWLQAGGVCYTQFPKEHAYALVIDCIFGTGFHGRFPYMDLAGAVANSGAKVLACDIPSGINGDNGAVSEGTIKADVTLCIGERKVGAYVSDAIDYTGRIECVDIGITLPKEPTAYAQLLMQADVAAMLPRRNRNSHKGTYGKAAIVAGSLQYSGAAYLSNAALLATVSCMRSGAGYTALYVPKALIQPFMLRAPEALLVSTNDGGRYAFNEDILRELTKYDAVAFGMGMGQGEDVQKGAVWLLTHYQGKLILDADALNALAQLPKQTLVETLQNKTCDVVMTPHVKEFSRLIKTEVSAIQDKGLETPASFASAHNVTLLLKNAVTTIACPGRVRLQIRGSAGQAKAGSGDVLSGVIAGLCASGLSCFDAACAGSLLCGVAAELAVKEIGEYSLLASDVIHYLGKAFVAVQGLGITENANANGENE